VNVRRRLVCIASMKVMPRSRRRNVHLDLVAATEPGAEHAIGTHSDGPEGLSLDQAVMAALTSVGTSAYVRARPQRDDPGSDQEDHTLRGTLARAWRRTCVEPEP